LETSHFLALSRDRVPGNGGGLGLGKTSRLYLGFAITGAVIAGYAYAAVLALHL
jgi:hypothetical protein